MDKGILFGIGGIIVGFIFNGLLKERWKSILAKENEKLKNEFSKELTALQSTLTSQREKDSFKFSKFHEKKFEVYEELYGFLNKYLHDLTIFCNPYSYTRGDKKAEEFKDSAFEQLLNSQKEFLVYFDNKKIYLHETLIQKITDFLEIAEDRLESNALIIFFEKLESKTKNEIFDKALNAYEEIYIKLIPIKIEIEKILKDELSYYEQT